MRACEPRADEWLQSYDGVGSTLPLQEDFENAVHQMLKCMLITRDDTARWWSMYAVDRARALGLYHYQAQIESEQP